MRNAKKKTKLFQLTAVALGLSLTTPCMTTYCSTLDTYSVNAYASSALEVNNIPIVTDNILSIDNSNYTDLLSQYDEYLKAKTPQVLDNIISSLEDNEFYSTLIRRTFIDRLGADNLERFAAKSSAHADFLAIVFDRSDLLDLFLQARVDYKQDRLVRSLDIWKNLWDNDKDCHNGFYAKFAIAMALAHGNPIRTYDSKRSVIDPVVRYNHYKKLNTEGKLFDTFNNLDVTHLTMVADNSASEEDMDWIHDYLRANKPEFISQSEIKKAAFLIPYGRKSGLDYSGDWQLKDMLVIGGVCTRISCFGSLIYRSFGVPSSSIRQPGHMAFLYMPSEYEWKIGNNIGGFKAAWYCNRTNIPWHEHPVYAVLLEEATKERDNLDRSNQLLWLSEVTDSTSYEEKLIDEAIDINSYNLIAWHYKIDCMTSNDNTTSQEYKQLTQQIIDNFTYHPKVMVDLIKKLPQEQIAEDRDALQKLISDIYAAFDKNTHSYQLDMIKSLYKEMQSGFFNLSKFSFNGENAGRLMGINKGEEYSLDGGFTYKTADSDDLLLSKEELSSITSEHNILIRVNESYAPYIIHIFNSTLKDKFVVANNDLNTLSGLNTSMEFSTDKVNWTKYNNNNLPDLTGNVTIYIRNYAKGTYLASNILTRKFTTAVFSFSGENANRLMGLKKGEQYSLDGGSTYKIATEDNIKLTDAEIRSLNSKDNILFKPVDFDGTIEIRLKDSQLKEKHISHNNLKNTITGLNNTMEVSIDKINWTRYNGENLPDLSGNITIYIRKAATGLYLPSNIITKKFTAATFSFSGENANRLMGMSTDYEYSLDGGKTYTTPSVDNVLLTKDELDSITTTHGILVRKKDTDDILKIKIVKEGLLWSTIKSNDKLNTLTGIRSGMEFSIDNKKTWTRYNGNNLPDLTGNLTIHVRKYAKNNALPSPAVTRTFTAATFSFSGENAGRLMGITPDVEYSLDGGKTYTTPSMEDVLLTDSELESINYNNNILLRTKGEEKAYTININKSTLKSNSLVPNDTNNTIKLYSSYEYSFDKVNWIRYNGNNAPDLSGNVTVYVRRAAAGTTAASNIISVKYTIGRFSFDGTNAGRLMGVTTDTEYSFDGGKTFTTAKEKNVLLTKAELESITTTHGILLRMIGTDDTQLIKIGKNGLWNSTIKADNTNNTLKGISKYMEFSIDNKQTWTKYTGSNLPDLTGNVTIHVRKYARGTSLPSQIVTRKFTGNTPSIDLSHITFSFDGENAGRLDGITAHVEYSLDGGTNYITPSQDDVLLSDTELQSINSEDNILLREKTTGKSYTIYIDDSELSYSNLDTNDDDDTINLDTSLEYSFDGNSWTKYDGSNDPDLTGDVTIYVRKSATGTTLESNIVEATYTEAELITASFSFDGENAGRLMGITTDAEYSLDGGDSYTTPSEDNVLLADYELDSINSKDDILIRTKATDKVYTIDIDSGDLDYSSLDANDTDNTISLDTSLEYSYDGDSWTKYDGSNEPDLTGDVTIYVRKLATGTTTSSDMVEVQYTENMITPDIPDELDTVTFSFDGSKAGRLMGITTYAEYSFDGGDSYTTPSEDDVLLTKDELESMTSTDGILIRLKGTDKTQLIKLDQRTIHPRNVKSNDNNNTVTINKNMEFSIDNKNTWTRYNGNNLPDLTGNITIHLRKYATGRSLPSKTVTKKFTAN